MFAEKNMIKLLWKVVLEDNFNAISVDQLFKYPGLSLVVGCEDGVVKIFEIPSSATLKPKCLSSLESKGGPIQVIAIHDVTKLYANDLIVADSRGTVTVFCNEQILNRKAVSEYCIDNLLLHQDAIGNIAIVTSDKDGHISAFNPYANLWRIRITDIRQLKGLGTTPYINSLLQVSLLNGQGQKTDYVLAADNCKHLYLLHQGSVVMVINTPAPITAMCSGYFINPEEIEGFNAGVSSARTEQVALASNMGAIYIMNNFEVYSDEFANIQLPMTKLETLPAVEPGQQDSILCVGNFNALIVITDGKESLRYTTPSWVNSLVTRDLDSDDQKEIVLGCMDRSIHALKIGATSS